MMKPTPQGPTFKSREEILAECATVGEAGVKDVRIDFGSWNEWSRDPTRPIETGYPFARAA
jgi:thiosulfate/3-mercaptopyruvate sulfurtransferase